MGNTYGINGKHLLALLKAFLNTMELKKSFYEKNANIYHDKPSVTEKIKLGKGTGPASPTHC